MPVSWDSDMKLGALSLDAGEIVLTELALSDCGMIEVLEWEEWAEHSEEIGNDAERKVSSGGKAVDEHVISWFAGQGEVVR